MEEDFDALETSLSLLQFSAPFFTCWFCTGWTGLFFPLYLVLRLLSCEPGPALQYKHLTFRSLLLHCLAFCLLSVLTNYLYIRSLQRLDCTVVTALFATNACFVYLLSWVVLKQQFVGVRIVALVLSTTGISLLAYMDQRASLASVLTASAAAAGTAVYKVMFKKLMGDVSFLQVGVLYKPTSLSSIIIN